jgi:hypothetical protein
MTSSVSELHEPLADGHIRLLELNFEHEHDIVGRLRAVELTAAPEYYALSYVCGTGPYEHEVTINNALFKVKPNLHTALRRLQSYFRSAGTLRVLIWIDAICINQDDADEKAKQIQGMHGVFSKAETVLIALGPVPENVHMVLSVYSWIELYTALDPKPLIRSELLERLEQMQGYDRREIWVGLSDLQLAEDIERLEFVTQQLKTRHKVDVRSLLAIKTLLERLELFGIWIGPDGKAMRTVTWTDLEEKRKLAVDFPGLTDQLFRPNHTFWAGVYALSEIEWHQRVWTYQEVFLAQNAEVLAEGLSVDWDYVNAPTIGLIVAMETNTMFEKIDPKATIVGLPTEFARLAWHFRWQNVAGSGEDKRSLIDSLIWTRNRKSTLAKDKVYGLLAVVPSDVRAQIPIDYTTTDGEVFASAVKVELKEARAVRISSVWELLDGNPSAMAGLPSWCPDFANMPGPTDRIWHHHVPSTVQQQTSAFAYYEHTPGFQTIRLKVLKLTTTARCMDIACPLDDTRSQSSLSSDSEASRTLETALKHWLVKLRATFSEDDSAPDLTDEVTEFLYASAEPESLLPFETFCETLNHMLSFVDSGQQPSRVCDRPRDWAGHRDTLTILLSHSGRYLLKTTSGEVGFGTRQQTPGSHVILLPRSGCMHMLTRDCTQYSGIVSVPGMLGGDALLEFVKARENMWEIVELR